jgi:hypothetical protein
MKNNGIIQFVGFITSLDSDTFVSSWDQYARAFLNEPGAHILQESTVDKSRFKYVSRHASEQGDLRFRFMKGRETEHFAGQKVKVVQAGGFMPMEQQPSPKRNGANGSKVIAFHSHNENDIDSYRIISGINAQQVYQAYYESCLYGYIIEYIAAPASIAELLIELNARPGCDASNYKSCLVPHL